MTTRRRKQSRPRQIEAAAKLLDQIGVTLAASTTAAQRTDLKALARYLDLDPATPAAALAVLLSRGSGRARETVDRWVGAMRGRLSPATINRRLATLRAVIRKAYDYRHIQWTLSVRSLPASPMRDTRGPGFQAVRRMIAVAAEPGGTTGARDVAILRLFYDLALRCGEVVELSREHVDLDRHTIEIMAKGKTETQRLSLPLRTEEALTEWIVLRGDHDGPLWPPLNHWAKRRDRLTTKALAALVARIGRRADAGHVTPHGIRHTAITRAYEIYKDPVKVQRFARHADIRITMRYVDATEDIAGEVAEGLANDLHASDTDY